MSQATFWKALYLTTFSPERGLYQRIKQRQPKRIVELGVGDLSRAQDAIAMAAKHTSEKIQYCGIDLFDARDSESPLTLKDAHQQLGSSAAQVRLVPGDLFAALGRTARVLKNTDLLIIDGCYDKQEIGKVAHFIGLMLHDDTSIARFDGKQLRWLKPDTFTTSKRAAA